MSENIKEKTFFCECGKCFTNPQSFNGHKSHCKEHFLSKYHSLIEYNLMNKSINQRLAKGLEKKLTEEQKQKEKQKLNWISEKHRCEKCGKIMTHKYASGRFCSPECSHSKVVSEETKQKISNSLKVFRSNQSKEKNNETLKKECKNCGKPIKIYNRTCFCRNCLTNTEEGKKILKLSAVKGAISKKNNGFKPKWMPRNVVPIGEKFFKKFLTLKKIKFVQNFPVKHISQNYVLDFLIELDGLKIDLEIDGHQHLREERKKHDQIRDSFLQEKGYIVYRISWPSTKSKNKKNKFKKEVYDFLEFVQTQKNINFPAGN